MDITIPPLEIPLKALAALAELTKLMHLKEIHIVDSCIVQRLPCRKGADPADCPLVVADLRDLLGGPAFQFHANDGISKRLKYIVHQLRNLRHVLPIKFFYKKDTYRSEIIDGEALFIIKKLPRPDRAIKPLNMDGAIPLCDWFTLTTERLKCVSVYRGGDKICVDILIRSETPCSLEVLPDKSEVHAGCGGMITIHPLGDDIYDAKDADAVWRSRFFFPSRMRKDIDCRIYGLPREPHKHWLISKIPIGKCGDSVYVYEKLTLVRNQYRKLSEPEITSQLNTLPEPWGIPVRH